MHGDVEVVGVVAVVGSVAAEAVEEVAARGAEIMAVLARHGQVHRHALPIRALADPAAGGVRAPAGVRGLRWGIALQAVAPVAVDRR
ncbi:hypothetical protein CA54_58640 [Symmachiella macrocystis]|uniref:Uncharacterized protein n=1 Tax=Symmachiella macrocystis TaxID=2527985 RepID=A0A5C6B1R1_9PLAN|nr:hypothetical protein CA54_58640 [Symmachiella macrocystis]